MEARRGVSARAGLEDWIAERVARELRLHPARLDRAVPLSRYGLDSLAVMTLWGDLEEHLGRTVPAEAVEGYPSIRALAARLAGGEGDTPSPAAPALAAASPSLHDRTVRTALPHAASRLLRLEVTGEERLPAGGPLLIAVNHLHVLDAPVVFAALSRSAHVLVAEHMRRRPLVDWFLRRVGAPLYVEHDANDAEALQRARAVLAAGGTLVMAPEGRISRTGGLLPGQPGAAWLAAETQAPVLPVAAWGQERTFRTWLRLRRPAVHVSVGTPLAPPARGAAGAELAAFTTAMMRSLAALLPAGYRGVYGEGEDGILSSRNPRILSAAQNLPGA